MGGDFLAWHKWRSVGRYRFSWPKPWLSIISHWDSSTSRLPRSYFAKLCQWFPFQFYNQPRWNRCVVCQSSSIYFWQLNRSCSCSETETLPVNHLLLSYFDWFTFSSVQFNSSSTATNLNQTFWHQCHLCLLLFTAKLHHYHVYPNMASSRL